MFSSSANVLVDDETDELVKNFENLDNKSPDCKKSESASSFHYAGSLRVKG